MRSLLAAKRRNGSTGRLPSGCRALAIPAKQVMSSAGQQGVPPGRNGSGHEAGGLKATLWKSASLTDTPRVESHELNMSLMGPPLFISDVSVLPLLLYARLFRRMPTDVAVAPLRPSMSTCTPLLNEVLL